MNRPQIGLGQVRHARLRPVRHAFQYATFFLRLPMRSWAADPGGSDLARNRWAPVSFYDSDHGDGGPDALAWIESLLATEGITDADGEIWLQCFPRVFGFAFKPVSFWYCHRADGHLRAIVAEVNNTFGERHCYLLDQPAWGRELGARKVFHVSPFCAVEGGYRFRFLHAPQRGRCVVRIDHDDAEGPLLQTSVSGTLQDADAPALRRALWRHPLLGAAIVWRIHWHALRLWLRRVGFHRKPAAPTELVTR